MRIVECQKSGQTFEFRDEWNNPDGKVKQLKYSLKPGRSVARHMHPNCAQSFIVTRGVLHVCTGGKTIALEPGMRITTDVGGQHSQWNQGTETVEVLEGYDPPLGIEPFFTALPLALTERNPLKVCVFFADFSSVVTSRWMVTRGTVSFLGWLGRLLGYEGWYKPA